MPGLVASGTPCTFTPLHIYILHTEDYKINLRFTECPFIVLLTTEVLLHIKPASARTFRASCHAQGRMGKWKKFRIQCFPVSERIFQAFLFRPSNNSNMYTKKSMEQMVEWYRQRRREVLREFCPIATSSTTHLTRTVLGWNPDLLSDRPAYNRLSCGKARTQ
jgi:hypothetical protein